MDTTQLIKAAQKGDALAFEQLLSDHYDTLYRFALKWSGNREDAEDITQLACIKLARGIQQFRFESAFSSWLYRLVINCAKDWQKSERRHFADEREFDDQKIVDSLPNATSTSVVGESLVYLRQVLTWVEELGEDFKETLLLVFAEGLSHREAATILNVKESTVSWRIHNIRQKLVTKEEASHA